MKKLKKPVFAFLIMLLTNVAFGQSDFEVQGLIIDKATQSPLPGASIMDSAQFNGTSSDVNGRFRLGLLKNGQTTLTITYLGYESHRLQIVMPRDNNKDLMIELTPITSDLNEVTVVSSSIEGQQRALNQQRVADNIKNIISADLIGKFPDQNVAEALQRVPGVNIARDKGEGSTVTLRGTPQHFTNISINGEQLASVQQNGGRVEALDLIPADQLGSMEVTKALTANMDGDAIGGNINLRTPTARRSTLQIKGDAGLGFNDLSGKLNGIGKLRLSQRFFKNEQNSQGRLGVLLSGSYYQSNNMEDRMDATWSSIKVPVRALHEGLIMPLDFQYRKTENVRTRIGATATFDYKVKNHEIIFNYMYNYRNDDDLRNRLRYDFNRSSSQWITLDSMILGRNRRDINIWDELKTNHNFNLEGIHNLNRWTVDWGAFYTTSKREHTSTRGDFSLDNVGIIANNSRGILEEVPNFTLANGLNTKNPLVLNDFRRYEEDMETTNASNLVGRFNVKREYALKNNIGDFQFGAKVRSVTNDKFRNNRVFSFFDPNQVVNLAEAFANVVKSTEPIDFLNGRYEYGPRVDEQRFKDYMHTYRRLLVEADDSWDAERISKNDTYEASENVYAGYLMNRLQIKKMLIIAGLRYEHNEVNYDAFDVKRTGTTVVATPIQGGNSYGYLLPSLHLKYSQNSLMNYRFAYTQSYAKPNFVDIVPFVNYDADAIRLFLGNPDLKPSLSNNLDLMVEKYNRTGGILSAGLFYKSMNGFQFTRIIPALTEDFPGFPQTVGFEFRQEQNGESAQVYGFELNVIQQLQMLPGALNGISVFLNYTLTESNARIEGRENMRLPGQARHTGNASLSFDYKGFGSKISLNYNGEYTNSVASGDNDDIIQGDRYQLDFNLNQKLSNRLSIYAEFSNITNTPSVRYQGNDRRISRIAYFGWWTRFGLSFNL